MRCSGFVVDGRFVDVMFPGTDTSSSFYFWVEWLERDKEDQLCVWLRIRFGKVILVLVSNVEEIDCCSFSHSMR